MRLRRLKTGAGFTLIEMIVVIMIISILAVVIIVQLPTNPINISVAAEVLANDLRFTQALAMTRGQRFYLFRPSSNSYEIISAGGTAMPTAGGASVMTFPSSIIISSNLPNNLVEFDGRGVPYSTTGSPGTALSAQAVITLTVGSQLATVTVNPGTGLVTSP